MSLANHIRTGYEVVDHGDVAVTQPLDGANEDQNPKHLNEMLASAEAIIPAVSEILNCGELPVILGGDHSIAVATFSAIASHYKRQGTEIGLIWLDAHADINTPETSPSGNIHGM